MDGELDINAVGGGARQQGAQLGNGRLRALQPRRLAQQISGGHLRDIAREGVTKPAVGQAREPQARQDVMAPFVIAPEAVQARQGGAEIANTTGRDIKRRIIAER